MDVVVVGGGLGGMAAAARLAKQGHAVRLVERADHLGGALAPVRSGDLTWDATATSTVLPAVVRDLFRKTGRPLERELDLVAVPVPREHRFPDGSRVALPTGSRAAQLEALGSGLGAEAARRWLDHVAAYAPAWEALRRDWAERPWSDELASPAARDLLRSRTSLHRHLRRSLTDPRLRALAAHPVVLGGHDPRSVPWWVGLESYLEQRSGTWTVPGGLHRLVDALAARLATRGVEVLLGTQAHDVVLRGGRPVAVSTAAGEVGAGAVVCAVDPRRLPSLAPYVARTTPALPPVVSHVALDAAGLPADAPPEVVVHGDATFVVRTTGQAPAGRAAWTVLGRGRLSEDLLRALARTGIDLRERVLERHDRSPREAVQEWGGSPYGVQWAGRRTVTDRLGPRTPLPGVYACGAHATPGAGLPFVGLSAALVAQAVGPA